MAWSDIETNKAITYSEMSDLINLEYRLKRKIVPFPPSNKVMTKGEVEDFTFSQFITDSNRSRVVVRGGGTSYIGNNIRPRHIHPSFSLRLNDGRILLGNNVSYDPVGSSAFLDNVTTFNLYGSVSCFNANGSFSTSFNRFYFNYGKVYDATQLPNGNIVIVGNFRGVTYPDISQTYSTPRGIFIVGSNGEYISHPLNSGKGLNVYVGNPNFFSLDSAYDGGNNTYIKTIVNDGTHIYIGGNFENYDDNNLVYDRVWRLAKINASSGILDSTFTTAVRGFSGSDTSSTGPAARVNKLLLNGETLLIAGYFDEYYYRAGSVVSSMNGFLGVSTSNGAAMNALRNIRLQQGNVTEKAEGIDLVMNSAGIIFIGGRFRGIANNSGGYTKYNIACFDTGGSINYTFNSSGQGLSTVNDDSNNLSFVTAINLKSDYEVIAMGRFDRNNVSQEVNDLCLLNGSTGLVIYGTWGYNPSNPGIQTTLIKIDNDSVYEVNNSGTKIALRNTFKDHIMKYDGSNYYISTELTQLAVANGYPVGSLTSNRFNYSVKLNQDGIMDLLW